MAVKDDLARLRSRVLYDLHAWRARRRAHDAAEARELGQEGRGHRRAHVQQRDARRLWQEEGVAVKKHARAIPCATWEARNANSDSDAAMSPHDNAMSSAATIAKIFSGSFRIIMPITERVTS